MCNLLSTLYWMLDLTADGKETGQYLPGICYTFQVVS
jgi:hypothetical protein